jgi:hypothetical protein
LAKRAQLSFIIFVSICGQKYSISSRSAQELVKPYYGDKQKREAEEKARA